MQKVENCCLGLDGYVCSCDTYEPCATLERAMKGVTWRCHKGTESPAQRWMGKRITPYDVSTVL